MFGAFGSYIQLLFSAGLNSKSDVPLLDHKEIVLQLVWGMLFGVLGLGLFVNSDKIDSWQPGVVALIMGFASNAAAKNLTDALRNVAEIKRAPQAPPATTPKLPSSIKRKRAPQAPPATTPKLLSARPRARPKPHRKNSGPADK